MNNTSKPAHVKEFLGVFIMRWQFIDAHDRQQTLSLNSLKMAHLRSYFFGFKGYVLCIKHSGG